MPFPFVLPTTSSYTFSLNLSSTTHPSLPLTASTYRGVVRETLKKHKRLPNTSQSANLTLVIAALNDYIPYLTALDTGFANRTANGTLISIEPNPESPLKTQWRPTLSATTPGREIPRVIISHFGDEVTFTLSTLAMALILQARATLQPLFVTSIAVPSADQRTAAIQSANKTLLEASSIWSYVASRPRHGEGKPPCPDVVTATASALSALAYAEATLLAVLKDDPYPAVAAQSRNTHDKEWMYKAPTIPKVRALLFARLCLGASEHASQAHSSFAGVGAVGGKVDERLLRYMEDLRQTARARACRFFGIDSDLDGETGKAIAWLHAGLKELGVERKEGDQEEKKKGGLSFGKLKHQWSEKKEDKKVEKGGHWGADGGKMEEVRVLEMLEAKWVKENDTMNTQLIPPTGPLLAGMPSGREMFAKKVYTPPIIDGDILEAMRAPPDKADVSATGDASSDDEPCHRGPTVGAFPGDSYSRNSSTTYY